MCCAIKRFFAANGRSIGFKPAGGIKMARDAMAYRCLVEDVLGKEWMSPERFRIGASSLLDDVLKRL